MQNKSLVSFVLSLGVLCGQVEAQTPAPNIFPNQAARQADPGRWTGYLSVGYSTNYDVRGLIPSTTVCENLTSCVLSGCYKIDEKTYITARADYEILWDKGILDRNQLNFRGIIDHELTSNLTLRAGYDVYKGGILGYFAQNIEHNKRDMTQEVLFGFRYEFADWGLKNLYFGAQSHYSFYGMWGWWWDTSLGYKWEVSDRLDVLFTGTWYTSSCYWDRKVPLLASGTQAYVLQIDLPYAISDHVSIAPFVSMSRLGNGARKNRHLRDIPFTSVNRMFEKFGVVGGVNISYHF
jgi:hypothetical protein